jgi:hypothetical protein
MSVGNGSGIVKLMRGAVIVAAVGGLVGSVAPAGACPEGDAAAAQPAFALHELSASGIRMFPAASAAYDRAIEPLEAEPWLADLDGPSALNQVVVIDAAQYVLVSACKNHDCAENNLVVLYSRRTGPRLRPGLPQWQFDVDRRTTAKRGTGARDLLVDGLSRVARPQSQPRVSSTRSTSERLPMIVERPRGPSTISVGVTRTL